MSTIIYNMVDITPLNLAYYEIRESNNIGKSYSAGGSSLPRALLFRCGFKSHCEVVYDVLCLFQAYAEPDESVAEACSRSLFL